MKLVLIICDPTRRLVSDYVHETVWAVNKGDRPMPGPYKKWITNPLTGEIDESLIQVQTGIYYIHLARWLAYFPPKQIWVLDGDRFKINPAKELNLVETFLGLPNIIHEEDFIYNQTKGFFCTRSSRCLGEGKGRPHPIVNATLQRQVQQFYKPYDKKLIQLVDRPLLYTQHHK